MSLVEQIDVDLTEARRRRDDVALRTLGLLKSELVRAGKEPGAKALDDEQALRVVRREVKRRQEAATAYADAGRTESAAAEEAEAEVLRSYLPAELGDEELEAEVRSVVAELGATSPRDMGTVMKAATARVAGRAEPGRVAAVARRLLAG
jgi:uncharacterized protein YqeY